ncbi:amine oxidase [mine drainage metagenome]|uniref:Amine oxidase n=1 Tax=mine drainage metagenome TaxID=410659 RepID=T1BJI3_9ZZZZ
MACPNAIAVIGTGPMGLAVAYQAIRDGLEVTLYEVDDRIGGMTAAFDFDGLAIERFYHFICVADQPLFDLLEELGIEDRLRWRETRMGHYYQGRIHPWGNPVALLRFSGLGWISKIRYGSHVFLSTRRKDWRPLDKLEATRWIRRWVGNRAYEVLWRSLFDLKFYEYAHTLSAAWIWTRIKRIGTSRYSMMREKLGYLEGGSATLLNSLREAIEKAGGRILLKTPVQQILHDKGKIVGVKVAGVPVHYDAVVSTVPVPFVPQLIPDLPRSLSEQYYALKNIAVVCVIVKTAKPLTPYFWLNINDPDMDIPGLVEFTNLRPLSEHIIYVPFYLPGENPKYQDSDEIFKSKVRRYLQTIQPELRDEDILAMYANRYRYAQPICGPGYLDTLPAIRLPIDGLFVADTSYYYPEDRGVSESVRMGREIARMLSD